VAVDSRPMHVHTKADLNQKSRNPRKRIQNNLPSVRALLITKSL
jgi:hypothetical protein